jgi:NADPH-dependent 2,4-dienoyl-CoA reductase/sulfur reductase-like enzyme
MAGVERMPMTTETDICIVGAGPAGMAAAITAAKHGARVVVLDEQPTPGGQIFRSVTTNGAQRARILGADYTEGAKLAAEFLRASIDYRPASVVWQILPAGSDMPVQGRSERTERRDASDITAPIEVIFSENQAARKIVAHRLILATGAVERPCPIPGWTLPGVMTAGAAQILLKQSGIVPSEAVLAGSGPLIYLLAAQLIEAGARPVAIVETQPKGSWQKALPHMARALPAWHYIRKGTQLLAAIKKAHVPRYRHAQSLRAMGSGSIEAVSFTSGGRQHEIAASTLLLHQGVVPNVQISRALRLDHDWSEQQRCWHPRTDAWGNTSIDGIAIAGDGASIGGATTAEHTGSLAALEALHKLDRLTAAERDILAAPHIATRGRDLAIRPFLDALYPPSQETLTPPDETIVCRCEDVTAGDIRSYASLGCLGPNQTKAFGRAGMGPCQGRVCGLAVSEILAAVNGRSMPETGYYRLRMPTKPVTIAEMAGLAADVEQSD